MHVILQMFYLLGDLGHTEGQTYLEAHLKKTLDQQLLEIGWDGLSTHRQNPNIELFSTILTRYNLTLDEESSDFSLLVRDFEIDGLDIAFMELFGVDGITISIRTNESRSSSRVDIGPNLIMNSRIDPDDSRVIVERFKSIFVNELSPKLLKVITEHISESE